MTYSRVLAGLSNRADWSLEVWIRATESILREEYKQDVILHIDSPEVQHEATQEVLGKLNQHYAKEDMEPIHTVAEWIFPGWLYQREGLEGVFDIYPEQLQRILDNSKGYNWGTYFGRMIQRKDPETGETFNPLKQLISNMRRANEPDGNTFHACYELDIPGEPLSIPLYDPSSDRKLRRNLPCLSHLSFKLYEGNVHLTTLYRSHDYRYKVPGNLLGLARLQACVANEIDAGVGQLVVHSSRAIVDNRTGMEEFRNIVKSQSRKMDNQSLSSFN